MLIHYIYRLKTGWRGVRTALSVSLAAEGKPCLPEQTKRL
ncbi:hypothetical protein HMPREF0602_0524 [Neisseria meningitidis ATCC 13091]|uniref:Uncharacterized protein n=1 Tax=Neisseria meningitidis serogroup B (strain ATCC 13091 / M2091) TaxID=862513 RepID=E0N7P4_NEIM3|nr:hypothetical protein HMPREF0602_0524 [Neisseria meningitidis ATCC 13091]